MFRCYICRSLHDTPGTLIRHLKLLHGLYPGKKFSLICAQDCCSLQFKSFAGFRKHLTIVHKQDIVEATTSSSASVSTAMPPNVEFESQAGDPEVITDLPNPPVTHQMSTEMCVAVIAKLQGSGVANNVILSVVESMEELVNEVHTTIKSQVLNVVPPENSSREAVENVFENLHNPFSDLNTDAKWRNYYSEKWGVVEPVEIHLGVRYDSRKNRVSGMYEQVPVNDTFIYVPLLKTLDFIFKNKEVCSYIQSFCENDLYYDFCDGNYYKKHPLYSQYKNALQIQVYYDDFETANPLGSKQGIHKLGCLYFTLRNLPPHLNSSLINIHLISLFHSQDAKKYGIDKILSPFIEDIKVLEHSGMKVSFSEQPLRGTISQITGDNLGLNGILGYVESFSANYYCRMCLTDKTTAQTVFRADDSQVVLRTKTLNMQHYSMLSQNPGETSCYGIKRDSIFNSLTYFSVTDNYVFDIMHDILEGVGQYEIKLLLEYLSANIIPSENILLRVYAFNYGYMDKKNKPTKLSLQGNSIGLNASQTMCLIKNIPLIFGDVVPEGNRHWNLMLLLLDIINILFSPSITEGMTVYLKHLIAEHHRLFTEVYPQNNLIPKHHFMIHYPECIRQIGPLVHVWTMRYEAKHQFFKSCIKNFKNLTKSLALKHQINIAYHWESLAIKGIDSGPVRTVKLGEIENSELVLDYFNSDLSMEISQTNWVKCFGTEYRTDLVVCTDVVNEMPVFSKIVTILLRNDIYFVVSDIETVFVEHLHAFRVLDQEQHLSVIKPDELRYFKPFDLQMAYGSDTFFYVVPECCIL